mmetsp:Transcript_12121/g.21918  ORF Transcript_12121/g.21918 Transcript_12121/m.21918 type:complete len:341 (+) Transcript_12121:195-1217(+)
MAGCIRYCTSKRNGSTPCEERRWKSEVPRPSTSTSTFDTVGGSCLWSPTRVTQPSDFIFIKGTKTASSVACAASSRRTHPNSMACITGWSAPLQVQHTTSILARMAFSAPNFPRSPDSPAALTISRRLYCSRSPRMASGRPTRTTCSPAFTQPARRLSTAMLLSAAHRIGPRLAVTHPCTSSKAVLVFPAPGGPWISVNLRLPAASKAFRCESLHFSSNGEWCEMPAPLNSCAALVASEPRPERSEEESDAKRTSFSHLADLFSTLPLSPFLPLPLPLPFLPFDDEMSWITSSSSSPVLQSVWRARSCRFDVTWLAALSILHILPTSLSACFASSPTIFT